ncbi:MAG TPA: patatin-like phospholipase family protein [Polyangiaceae bacterium]|nr:patatin-like phospholipase family protein [Polyangiaceae bacterium]
MVVKGKPKVAFVATGGAARGIAHLGVLRACQELGVVPEIFVGTSTGAIVAATYGQGVPLDVLLDGYRLPWKRRFQGPKFHMSTLLGAPLLRDLLDPGYFLSGIFSIDGFERYLRAHLPCNDFRNIDNRVLITAVDIDRAERVVFGKGYDSETPVSRAVAASCCVPLLFRPYPINGRYHIDGEIARTLSADLALEAGADIVIISNVYRPEQPAQGERSLARRGPIVPLHQTLNVLLSEKERRGVDLYSRSHPRKAFIDIAPEIGTFGYLNRFAARSLVMRGYRAGLRGIAEAKERGVFAVIGPASEPLN